MTKLQPGKPLIRETAAMDRRDPIVVELHPKYIELRLKGKRSGVTVDYEAVLDLGRRLAFRRNGGH
jgi:hypothetical protein